MEKETWLRDALSDVEDQMRKNNLEGFKSGLKEFCGFSLRALEKTEEKWEFDHNSQEIKERFHVLRLYLEYLKRFADEVG